MKTKLDRTDYEIIKHLQNNARISNKELANLVGLAPSSCHSRMERLRKENVILNYYTEISPSAVGISLQAMIAVRMVHGNKEDFQVFRRHIDNLSEVVNCYHTAGREDFLIHVCVRDADHLRGMVLDQFLGRKEVEHVETFLILEYERKCSLPNYEDT